MSMKMAPGCGCCDEATEYGDCCHTVIGGPAPGQVIWPAGWATETCPIGPRSYGDLFVRFPGAAVHSGSPCGAVCEALAAGFVLPWVVDGGCQWRDLFAISNGCGDSTTWYVDVQAFIVSGSGIKFMQINAWMRTTPTGDETCLWQASYAGAPDVDLAAGISGTSFGVFGSCSPVVGCNPPSTAFSYEAYAA